MKKLILRALALTLTVMLALASSGLAETLRFRDTGKEVEKLQTALAQLGHYTKKIDGKFGTGTRTAVRNFQKAEYLKVDGLAGKATQARLTALTGIVFADDWEEDEDDKPAVEKPTTLFAGDYRTMQFGTAGNRVRILQRALLALGFDTAVDGDFGSVTHAAVKAFQRIVGLTQDGKAGKKTLQKLEKYFDENGKCTSGPIAGNTPAEPEADPNAPTYGMPKRTLRYGDKGLDVKYVMQRLFDLGYYNKKPDETFGSGMLTAVKAFQKKNKLAVDGAVGAKSLAVLFSDSALDWDDLVPPEPEAPRTTLKKGDKGDDVKAAQVLLASLGYYKGKLDGVFGSGMQEATRLFQARNALKVDGKIGVRTLAKLNSADAVPAKGAAPVVPDDEEDTTNPDDGTTDTTTPDEGTTTPGEGTTDPTNPGDDEPAMG